MSEKIQGIPRGLLDALGIKSVGRNPDNLLSEIRGSVDLLSLYETDKFDVATVTTATAGTGSESDLPVPAGEAWDVASIFVGFLGGAASLISTNQRISVGLVVAGTFVRLASGHTTSVIANNEREDITAIVGRRLLLPPGTIIRARWDNSAGGTPTDSSLEVGATFYRLSV